MKMRIQHFQQPLLLLLFIYLIYLFIKKQVRQKEKQRANLRCYQQGEKDKQKVQCCANIPKTHSEVFLFISVPTEMKQRTASGKGGVPSLRSPIPLPQNLPTTMVGFACAAEKRGGGKCRLFRERFFVRCEHTRKGSYLLCVLVQYQSVLVGWLDS